MGYQVPILLLNSTTWWGAGGAGKTCVAAYSPVNAVSSAEAVTNLVARSAYQAVPGASPPGWARGRGWIFSGAQHMDTGVTPETNQRWSMVVQFAGYAGGVTVLAGCRTGASARFSVGCDGTNFNYTNGGAITGTAVLSAGVAAIIGSRGFRNRVIDATSAAAWSGSATTIYVGALNLSGAAATYCTADIYRVAIYRDLLSWRQYCAIYAAMIDDGV